MLIGALLMTVVNSQMQAIVQTKVPQEWQGRVFGAVMFLGYISVPLATALSGPLADHVFEPQAAHGTGLFTVLGPLLGDRPGSGMAGMFLLAGLAGIGVSLWGLASRNIREIDVVLADVDVPDPDTVRDGAQDTADTADSQNAQEGARDEVRA